MNNDKTQIELIELLDDLYEYMGNKADADYEGQYRPNEEMRFLVRVVEMQEKIQVQEQV